MTTATLTAFVHTVMTLVGHGPLAPLVRWGRKYTSYTRSSDENVHSFTCSFISLFHAQRSRPTDKL